MFGALRRICEKLNSKSWVLQKVCGKNILLIFSPWTLISVICECTETWSLGSGFGGNSRIHTSNIQYEFYNGAIPSGWSFMTIFLSIMLINFFSDVKVLSFAKHKISILHVSSMPSKYISIQIFINQVYHWVNDQDRESSSKSSWEMYYIWISKFFLH